MAQKVRIFQLAKDFGIENDAMVAKVDSVILDLESRAER